MLLLVCYNVYALYLTVKIYAHIPFHKDSRYIAVLSNVDSNQCTVKLLNNRHSVTEILSIIQRGQMFEINKV